MNKKRKWLAAFLSLSLAVGLLSGLVERERLKAAESAERAKQMGAGVELEEKLLGEQAGKLEYQVLNNGTVAITGYHATAGAAKVTIPAEINGKKVTQIGDRAFEGCSGLTDVSLPEGLKTIKKYAFEGCSGLKGISLPGSLNSISQYAFKDCSALESVNLPEGLAYIGDGAFSGCISLEGIGLPKIMTSVKYGLFEGCTSLTSISLPKDVATIGGNAFKGCIRLAGISLPEGVTFISTDAFKNCNALTNVYFAGSQQQWSQIDIWDGNDALSGAAIHYNAAGLPEPEQPSTQTPDTTMPSDSQTDDHTGSTSPTESQTPNTQAPKPVVPQPGDTVISGKAAYKVEKEKSTVAFEKSLDNQSSILKIPDKVKIGDITYRVTSIADNALKGNKKITKVTVGKNVTKIGKRAFMDCRKLASVTVGASVKSIGVEAFKGCKSLKTIDIKSKKLSAVGKNALKGIKATAVIKAPKEQLKKYRKLFKKKGQGSKVKIK